MAAGGDWSDVAMVAVTLVNIFIIIPGGWFFKNLVNDVRTLQKDLNALQVNMSKNYMQVEHMVRLVDDIKTYNNELVASLRREILALLTTPPQLPASRLVDDDPPGVRRGGR